MMWHLRLLPKANRLCLFGAMFAFPLFPQADETVAKAEFNQSLLRSSIDVGMFSEGNPVAPGVHRIELYMNGIWKGREEVRFELPNATARVARPCFDVRLLDALGLDLEVLDNSVRSTLDTGYSCGPLDEILSGTKADFDSGAQRLDVIAPQLLLQRSVRGYVSPALWDHGINAGMLQYNYNAYHAENSVLGSHSSQYLGLHGGVNIDDWRLRYRGTGTWNNQGASIIQTHRPMLNEVLLLGIANS